MRPIVAIVGRPNAGKSTLFNRIAGKGLAVTEDIPGVTRDRLYSAAEWDGSSFIIVDTGGFRRMPDEGIDRDTKEQALLAVEEADVVIMLMDSKIGFSASDIELSHTLRKHDKKVFYAVNKIDGLSKEQALYDFYNLGVDLFPVSALHGYGFDELMDGIIAVLPPATEEAIETQYPRIAIVGRPNVGKSTLVNSLLGKQRMIVSPVPGTTRDSVDSICSYYRKKYLLVDTAGIRKKGKMAKTFERYSFIRTLKNIESCDVALIVLDAVDGVVDIDQRIAGLVHEAGKCGIVLFNKWDLTEKTPELFKKLQNEFMQKLWFMPYAPILTISAMNRRRVTKLFPLVNGLLDEASKRISTKDLNSFLKRITSIKTPPLYRGRQVKLSYISQVGINPPRFVIFTNKSKGIKPYYRKFLEKQLRGRFSFKSVPVRVFIRQKT